MSYTGDTRLDGPPQAQDSQAIAYLIGRGMDPGLAAEVVGHNWHHGGATGIDPVIQTAQQVKETRNPDTGVPLASWWASAPRRNPAGIGVTGASRPARRDGDLAWQLSDDGVTEYEGYAFADWNTATAAHTGHLLAYLLPKGAGTPAQQRYLTPEVDPRLPTMERVGKRGSAVTLKQLNGSWAVPGNGYGESIAAIANAIAATPGKEERPGSTVEICDRVSLIPQGNSNRPGLPLLGGDPEWFIWHDTGNPRAGANAEMHRGFAHGKGGWGGGGHPARWNNGVWEEEYEGVSFTCTVDDRESIQLLDWRETGWQASDGGMGPGNRRSNSMELCINADGDFDKAVRRGIEVSVRWCRKFGKNSTHMRQHYNFARDQKNCPASIRGGRAGWTWARILAEIDRQLGLPAPTPENPNRGFLFKVLGVDFPRSAGPRYLGTLVREGEFTDAKYRGHPERVAVYSKGALHSWQGNVQSFHREGEASLAALVAAGKVVLW